MSKCVFIVLGVFLLAALIAAQDKRLRQARYGTADGVDLKQKFNAANPTSCMRFAGAALNCCKLPTVFNENELKTCATLYPPPAFWRAQMNFRDGIEGKLAGQRAPAKTVGTIRTKRDMPGPKGHDGIPPGFRGPCVMGCYFNKTGLMTADNKLDEAAIKTAFKGAPNVDSKWNDIIDTAVDTCIANLTDLNKSALPPPSRGREGCSNPLPKFFVICFYRELALKCPADLKTETEACTNVFTGIDKCNPFFIPQKRFQLGAQQEVKGNAPGSQSVQKNKKTFRKIAKKLIAK